jgi:hypothetical protein
MTSKGKSTRTQAGTSKGTVAQAQELARANGISLTHPERPVTFFQKLMIHGMTGEWENGLTKAQAVVRIAVLLRTHTKGDWIKVQKQATTKKAVKAQALRR